jgi:hypothetical protein
LGLIASDRQPPRVLDIQETAAGLLVSFADAFLTEVRTVYGIAGQGTLAVIAEIPAQPTALGNQWLAPAWDRQWVSLRSGDNGAATPLPLTFVDAGDADGVPVRVFQARVDYVDADEDYSGSAQPFETAYLQIAVNQANQVVDHEVQPFFVQFDSAQDTQGTEIQEKSSKTLKTGDQLQLYATTLRIGQQPGEALERFGAEIVLAEAPQFLFGTVAPPPGEQLAYGVKAQDFSGNTSLSELVELP